ncbi:MAG: aspartate 1-decarboxylase, partial [Candidatus Omnitrophica bacterium]|nr:aspartate 1-decarboxylase [Candidatus Omnitrophota bacterium]
MYLTFCKSKIGHATITQAELYYEGSITIDENLINAVGIIPGEKVEVLNINNGARLETYVIAGKAGSGQICLNGPAARQGHVGDKLI